MNEHELDVSECIFQVKDADGNLILETEDYKRAFQTKQFQPGSKVFVRARVDVTIDEFVNFKQATNDEL